MAIEKNMPWGRQLSAPLGVSLVSAGSAISLLATEDAVQKKLGFVPSGREMRFSQTLQHNVEHVVTTLSRQAWQLRGSR